MSNFVQPSSAADMVYPRDTVLAPFAAAACRHSRQSVDEGAGVSATATPAEPEPPPVDCVVGLLENSWVLASMTAPHESLSP